jgi:hypothetical protein
LLGGEGLIENVKQQHETSSVISRRQFVEIASAAALGTAFAIASSSIWSADKYSSKPASESVPGDRWLEIDLYWFDLDHVQNSVSEFWDRFTPLFRGVAGDKGVILNVGWTVGYIME